MKRILLLLHEVDAPQGYVGELLEKQAIPFDVIDVENEALPALTAYQAVIAFGGAQHVYEEEKNPTFEQEKALLRQIVAQDIPFLGICLGGQLLASALGSRVHRHTIRELGFYEIALTEAGKKDPLYQGLPGYQKVFHWHEDIFDLPEGALLLATNKDTPNQAFRYGRRAYGLQYHIEVNAEIIDTWLAHFNTEHDIMNTPEISIYHTLKTEQGVHFPTYHTHTRIILENFLRISDLI